MALIALILVTQTPRVDDVKVFSESTAHLGPPVLAQNDIEGGVFSGGEGSSPIQEFRPRWADRTLVLSAQPTSPSLTPLITVQRGSAYDLDLTITSPVTTPLRFSDFYFPGWQITLEQRRVGALSIHQPRSAYRERPAGNTRPSQNMAGPTSPHDLHAHQPVHARPRDWGCLVPPPIAAVGVWPPRYCCLPPAGGSGHGPTKR